MSGYIKLFRGWHDSDQFTGEPYCERAAWVWLLTNAAWKETTQRNHKGEAVTVGRGQFRTSLRTLAAEWKWSVKRVRSFLKVLEKCAAVGTQRAHGGTIITICKYDDYQSAGHTEGTQEGTHGAQSGHTKEEGKEDKKEEDGGTSHAFFGRTIRLNARDLAQWERVYSAIPDLKAELNTIDAWWQGQSDPKPKNWFYRTSQMLNRKHQEILRAAEDDGNDWGEEYLGP